MALPYDSHFTEGLSGLSSKVLVLIVEGEKRKSRRLERGSRTELRVPIWTIQATDSRKRSQMMNYLKIN